MLNLLNVPSGDVFLSDDLALLRQLDDRGSIRYIPEGVKLKSGIMSKVYVSLRGDVTDHPELGILLGRKIAKTVVDNTPSADPAVCLIPIPTAATGIAAATSIVSATEGICTPAGPISYRVMREAVKAHGTDAVNWVNGAFDERHTFWFVDNVVTDCKSKLEARDRLAESGYRVDEMPSLIVVDRQQGGVQNMEKEGFKRIVVVYRLLDIAYAMGELGLWPKDVVKSVKDEIAAHQTAK